MPEAGDVRFALLGCGDIGVQNAEAIGRAGHSRLTIAYDPVAALAADIADRFGAMAVGSVSETVDAPDVDAVLVATPHDTHEALVRLALDAGRHVLLEKPLAADLGAAVRIARMEAASEKSVGVLFPLRSDPRFESAVAGLRSGRAGPARGAMSTYLIHKPSSYLTGGYSNRSPSSWRTSRERSGGGVLIMNVLHHIDAVRAAMGCDAETVFARTTPGPGGAGIEDMVSLIVSFGGALATFVGATSVFGGPGERLELWNGSTRVAILPESLVVAEGRPERAEAVGAHRPDEPRVAAIAEFARALRDGRSPSVPVPDALAVQAIVAAAYVSAAEDRVVSVAETLRDAGWE